MRTRRMREDRARIAVGLHEDLDEALRREARARGVTDVGFVRETIIRELGLDAEANALRGHGRSADDSIIYERRDRKPPCPTDS